MKIATIIPTYNERENLPSLVQQLLALDLDLSVIVVDDNSPDGTGELAEELSCRHERVHAIHRPGKLGLGTAHLAGFRYALSAGAARIVTMDADFSHHPRYVPALIAANESCDIVIGSRYVPGGGTKHWPWIRVLLSWGANMFARTLLGLEAHDCTAGFRCYRRDVLEALDLGAILSDGYSFLLELIYECQMQGWRIGEVPIVFVDRQQGASKISKQEIYKAAYMVIRLKMESALPAHML